MRTDFKKVLCEEPRHKGWGNNGHALNKLKGSKKEYQERTKGDWEDWSLPSKETMFGKRRRGTKEFGEHLGPLVRFLRFSVGKRWDDVFSEIRKNCPNNNAVNAHIYQHLWGYVERNLVFLNGDVHRSYDYLSFRSALLPLRDHGRDNTFYIEQEGILRRAARDSTKRSRRKEAEEKKKNSDVRVLDGVYYVRKDNVWYQTKLVPLPKIYHRTEEKINYRGQKYMVDVWYYPNFTDVFLGIGGWGGGEIRKERADECIRKYGKPVYCSQMTQLSSRKLHRLSLK